MAEAGLYTTAIARDKTTALRKKIAALEIEARAMRRVIEIAPADAIERACRALASGPEPEGYEARRLVLDGLLDLRVSADGTITGKLPVPAAEKNCKDRLAAVGRDLASRSHRTSFRPESSSAPAGKIGAGTRKLMWRKRIAVSAGA
jgi:hypothetical protein